MAISAQNNTPADAEKPPRPKGLALLRVALSTRKAGCMLGFGFSSGLPFALLIGTLNAWLGEVGIKLATIGVLSWIGLSYSFKFLWAPLVDRLKLPGLEALGRRRSWIILCQAVLACAIAGLAITDPTRAIGTFAIIAFIAAFASATQDIALDAWRIENADEDTSLELLTALYQFGYRTASIVGGALALMLAARMSWPQVFGAMAGLMAVMTLVTLRAPDTERTITARLHADLGQPGELAPGVRAVLLFIVLASWVWAIATIAHFMITMLAPVAPGGKLPSVAEFTKTQGPWIVGATVFVPLIVASVANHLKARALGVLAVEDHAHGPSRTIANHIYAALVTPLAELAGRLRAGVLVVLGFILTYAFCYNIWSSFAFPFYLDYLHYTKDQVAFASKIFGIIMTMFGISLGGYLFLRIGRFPTVLLGAMLPPLGNLLYADLADGGHVIDAFAHVLMLDRLGGALGADARMLRLLLAIVYENIATGLAGTAFVAYVSSVVSKRYTAIQYALLSSLTFLVGTLGRGVAGEAFDTYGYGPVFRATALAGVVSVSFVLMEWVRVSRAEARALKN
ncbi:MFS transporter [Novosphingobium sp. SG707]|uniref:AmpG family muropeptide MFS transporter n=1 Tax=Novosphingobium sp. SG707 TaxID=2586996 RepID=UPI00144553CB|nr:MFS transporter [Novosphingobium sp. SG707]NKJ00537.1 PAT family beta-lactamase induction signal transducer AmpG [Novosphingobium sp. SG707]